MSTITSLTGTDGITTANSMTKINTNFTNLNTDKIETSVIDTDTTLAANSDAKIPSQKAVKAYVDAGGNVNASTTVKGIVEEATQAEVDAGTATGGTGARLFVNPSTILRTARTLIPQPAIGTDGSAPGSATLSSSTTAILGQVIVPFQITVNKVSVRLGACPGGDNVDISLYSEDGQTRYFSVTSAVTAGSANTIISPAVSSVILYPGIYYVMINIDSTTGIEFYTWTAAAVPFSTTAGLWSDVSSEPIMCGTYTITSGTPPTTLTLSSITEVASRTPIIRLDN